MLLVIIIVNVICYFSSGILRLSRIVAPKHISMWGTHPVYKIGGEYVVS